MVIDLFSSRSSVCGFFPKNFKLFYTKKSHGLKSGKYGGLYIPFPVKHGNLKQLYGCQNIPLRNVKLSQSNKNMPHLVWTRISRMIRPKDYQWPQNHAKFGHIVSKSLYDVDKGSSYISIGYSFLCSQCLWIQGFRSTLIRVLSIPNSKNWIIHEYIEINIYFIWKSYKVYNNIDTITNF